MAGLAIEAEPGVVAASPEAVIDAIVAVAVDDGADLDEWLGKALVHAGASRASVVVRGEPRYRLIEDATRRADHVFRVALAAAIGEMMGLLEDRRGVLPKGPPE